MCQLDQAAEVLHRAERGIDSIPIDCVESAETLSPVGRANTSTAVKPALRRSSNAAAARVRSSAKPWPSFPRGPTRAIAGADSHHRGGREDAARRRVAARLKPRHVRFCDAGDIAAHGDEQANHADGGRERGESLRRRHRVSSQSRIGDARPLPLPNGSI